MRRIYGLLAIFFLVSHFAWVVPVRNGLDTESSAWFTRVERAFGFLRNQFNSEVNLCCEAPDVAPNTYWFVSDNLWAYKALEVTNDANISQLIKAELIEHARAYNLTHDAQGLPISYAHEAVIGDTVPVPFRANTDCILHSNDYTLKTTIRNGTVMVDWKEYGDLLLYAALSCHWEGKQAMANQYFNNATDMWDGIGINDAVTKDDGFYTTFKLALLLYTSKVLGRRLPFGLELLDRIWSLQNETNGGIITNYFENGTALGDANTETTSIAIIAIESQGATGTFAFYYPWYGTPDVSGYWLHWNDSHHDPENFTDGERDIAASHYPMLGVYDCNNESLIQEHIDMAKAAGIDGFIISWWGMNHFTDNASVHIKDVCERSNFKFTFYYEETSGIEETIRDITYILQNYANSSAYYKIDNRPVIYIYARARYNLNPEAWRLYGNYINESESVQDYWMPSEEVRKPQRYGIFPIHPDNETMIGYIENVNPIFLQPNTTYTLRTGISDIQNDCPNRSDVGFRIKIRNETGSWETLNDTIINFNEGWLDLTFNISSYAGQNVTIRVESYAGGEEEWCSEWAAVDYLYIENSNGKIVSPEPFFDNGWKTVTNRVSELGNNPYLIMDLGGYEEKLQEFADYFLDFTDGMHIYNPVAFNLSRISQIYHQARNLTLHNNKSFVATVMPGYNDTEIRSPGLVVERENGTYYRQSWSVAKNGLPDGYLITSFNEWHEGTEIEASKEYGDQYIELTRTLQTCIQDIKIVGVEPSLKAVSAGDMVDVIVTVENYGIVIQTFNITLYANNSKIGTLSVSSLPPSQQANITFHWDTTGVTIGNYTISANATTVGEDYSIDNFFVNGTLEVIPEFPSFLILPLFMLATLPTVIVFRRRPRNKTEDKSRD